MSNVDSIESKHIHKDIKVLINGRDRTNELRKKGILKFKNSSTVLLIKKEK